MNPTPPPSLPQIIDALITLRLAIMHTSMPGRVESYNKATQTARVQPLLKHGDIGENGRTAKAYAPINACPVICLGGAAGYLHIALKPGDTGMLLFSEGSLDRHKLRGGLIDPEDDRRFHLSDAVFIPGYRAARSALANMPADAVVLAGDDVRLGAPDADQRVQTERDGSDFMKALTAAIATAPSTGVQALTALQTALQALPGTAGTHSGQAWPVGSPSVKAED